jgi:hypothetical protein
VHVYHYHRHVGWILAIVCVLPLSGLGQWQRTRQAPTQLFASARNNRMTVADAQTGSGPEAENFYENLITKAKSQGSVRVIVRLKLDDWQPERALRDQQAMDAQREAIARLQDRLLHNMVSFIVTDIRRFRFIPQIALTVDEAGLRVLISHPDVSTI